ncbi:methionine--tRNA ligase [Arthrobacter sp. TPD3018]|uniref:methionine--tRNA ligase n=1 Tax=Bacteria TaxID=2 RepID=UPI000D518C3E|nr:MULTISPECIES: methionine--tRNA ligase [Bacteria]PVE60071.1 methionine--tRNA ligase [Sphingomonas sp. TPD3009]PVE61584.1 methionine--tRNA ligase [Arthrobacter sp. TPD3018]PVE85496.1 methionine--tRNA ligase [Sphingomonas melonis]
MADPYYITTAIHYPNGRPHIGHAYEMIAADAIARFQRQAGRDVRLQTGTDEHGLKMAQTARARGINVRAFADEMSSYFSGMADTLDISYDRFIRTVEPDHYAASQAIWQAMRDAGDLYLDRYEGWYSVRDEAFYDEKELVEGEGGAKLSPQGTPVEWTAEETWFFRLSKYQQPLLDLYTANPDFIRPEARRNEVMRFVEGGLSDLSVSRTSFDWGVPVPDSPGHIMYVWVDALTNYLTGAGYPNDAQTMARFWPADLHLIGKDITRFHAVYWPAFLMSANLPLPKQVFAHGFVLHRGEKMSKSVGNVVSPDELTNAFGVDAVRYFLLREVSFGQDGSYSAEAIVTRVNAELANSFGNLAQRTLSFIAKNLDGALPEAGRSDPADAMLIEEMVVACAGLRTAFDDLMLSQGIEAWMRGVFACNQYIDAQAPWTLRKTDPERMHAVLGTLVRAIRMLAIAILPVVPQSAGKVLDQLGATERDHAAIDDDGWYARQQATGFTIAPPSPVFPRLELPAAEA